MAQGVGRGRSAGKVLVALLAVAVAVGAGWWAARATLEPQESGGAAPSRQVVWAEVTQSSVGRSLALSTTLRQPARVVATNAVPGVVLSTAPGEVRVGDTVYVVAGAPVRVVAGQVPFYRELSLAPAFRDWLRGPDVEQLQVALVELGLLKGRPDGVFGPATQRAVMAWQKGLGVPQTGSVPLGEVIAVDALPTVVQLGESIQRGKTLAGGEDAVLAPTGEQQFVLVVTQEQTRLIPAEATVNVTWQDTSWPAVIAGSMQDEFGNTEFELTAPDGGPVCADACGTLPGDAQVTLRSQVIIVPELSGPAVPAAAVHTRADGTAYVIAQDGERDVTVLGSGGGIAVVQGVQPGARVQVLADQPGTPVPAPAPGAPDGPGGDGDGDTATDG